MTPAEEHRAVRVVAGDEMAPVLLMCEHASERLPAPWTWPQQDRWLIGSHWSYDPGAAEICEGVAAATGAVAVLAQFTRLLIDPNRPTDAETLIRRYADGRVVELNRRVDRTERERRVGDYWRAYHDAVDRAVGSASAPVLLAVHTFTPEYEGERRDYEAGVLFDHEATAAAALAAAFAGAGISVRLNEPYSGKGGFIYSVERHAARHGRRALEIEIRQDRATNPAFRAELVKLLAAHRWAP